MNPLRSPVRKCWLHGHNKRTIPSESEQRLVGGYPGPTSSHHETAVMASLTFSGTDIWGELESVSRPHQLAHVITCIIFYLTIIILVAFHSSKH